MRRILTLLLAGINAVVLFSADPILAAELEIFPGESFEEAAENLAPGDILTVHEGTYTDSGRISIGVKGTSGTPVTIQAAPGEARPLITRAAGDAVQNTINIEGAEHLTIRGIEISSNGGDGINMNSNPSHITLEDLVIHDISVGINFRSDMHHITARRNHIYRTSDTGEGMYVGCNFANCAVSDSLIEQNRIHDTLAADQGDGIEIKRGSHSNIIRDNVIHDTNFPCILLYGSEGNPRNIVEGNAMWNCGDSGIQAAADTLIRNNIILESPGNGFNSQSHQGVSPANLEFVHNTVIGGSPCIRLNGWDGKQGLVFANNTVYCPSDGFSIGGLSGVAISGNVIHPASGGFPTGGYTSGRSLALDFQNALQRNVYPSSDSALLSAGVPDYAAQYDFNGTDRNGSLDAGAYAWTGAQNPGWPIAPGFKQNAPGPTLSITADPTTVDYQSLSTLTWNARNVVSCSAGGDWSGARPFSGTDSVGPLVADSTFELSCTSASADPVTDAVTVSVSPLPANPLTLVFAASDSSVPLNGSTDLSWSATGADSCDATGHWSGPRPEVGNENTGPLAANVTFSLSCTGAGGTISRSVTVQVQSAAPGAQTGNADSSGGGSFSLVLLFALIYIRVGRFIAELRRPTRNSH